MHLKLLRPTEVVIDQPVLKVAAEGVSGSFCLLPHHVDIVTPLVPGLFAFESEAHETVFLAVDEGVLVKQGAAVWVSVRQAGQGDHLDTLQQAVQQQFHQLDEREQRARSMLTRLETSLVREFIDLGG